MYRIKEAIHLAGPDLISPLLDGFVMGPPISSHHGIRCCPAMKHNSDNKYIVKIIAVPSSQAQLDALLHTGAYNDPGEVMDHFRSVADGITKEAELLSDYSLNVGFLPCLGHQVVPMRDNKLGYLVYLVSSYKRSLDKYARREATGALGDVLKLGLDMCTALSSCRSKGYMYVGLKPTNIFLSEDKEFRIGDIGFVPLEELAHTALPPKYRSAYSAPEILDPLQTLNTTVDTYALGMILYQICNGGKLPDASVLNKDTIPAPQNGCEKLREVIMKAISSDVSERFSDPEDMKNALSDCIPDDVKIYSPTAGPVLTDSDTQVFSTEAVNNAVSTSESDTKVLPTAQIKNITIASDTRVVPTQEVREAIRTDDAVDKVNIDSATTDAPIGVPGSVSQETKVMSAVRTAPSSSVAEELQNGITNAWSDDTDHIEDDADDDENDVIRVIPTEKRRVRKPMGKGWIAWILVLLFLGALGYGGYYYYTNYYLQTIDSMTISGEHDNLIVQVVTQTDHSLLTVTCSDTYGNSMKSGLINGKAEFTGLLPSSQYKISIEIDGFHQLKGKTSGVFNTETRTEIVSFTGIAGSEDGSVMLTFTVDGPEPEKWMLTYSADGVEPLTEEFTGHNITVRGLDYPKMYTFTLTPSEEMFVTGQTSMEFNSTALIMAKNLTIISCSNGEMNVRWEVPAETTVESWTVRCYSDGGYDQTLVTSETNAVFTGLDHSFVYYVEVIAAGMTQPSRTSITADPITITGLTTDLSDPESLVITWDYVGDAPDGGWLLMYSLDGTNTQSVVKCSGPSAKITPVIYGAEYSFMIQAADSTSIFENEYIYLCPEAEDFKEYSYDVSRTTAYMVVTPEKENWTSADVNSTDHTDTFHLGESISFLLFCDNRFYIPAGEISILYVIRDDSGDVIGSLISQETRDWHEIWVAHSPNYAEFDLPAIPTTIGSYTLSVYFNGCFIVSTGFSITE